MKQYTKSIRGKLFKYFSQRLNIKPSTRGWYRCDCTYCGGKYTMGINLSEKRAKCFKCDERVTPVQLLMDMENFTQLQEVWNFLQIQQEYEGYSDFIGKKVDFKTVELPESYRLITQGDSFLAESARRYMKKRGYNLDYLESKGIGFCTQGKYAGYIIFPCYQGGQLIFFQGRRFLESAGPKMKNPDVEEFGIGKTKVIYNSDALFIYNTVYIGESITNALTLGDRGVANFGKDVSTWQMSYFINAPFDNAVIILDPDAYDKAILFAMQLVHHKRVKVVKFPEGTDVNDLGKKKALKYIKETPWQSYSDLLKIKISLNAKGPQHTHQRERFGYSSKRGF